MDIGVEISLYPLHQQYLAPIQDFIDRLNTDGRLRVVTNSMSTQIFGDYDAVMQRLARELRASFETNDKAVFVLKILGPLAP
ncbi:MAG TPA: YkoF family thiamine/hydroxymethylpyrimidine-binding protein [Steroidobacteraceae bacterium]